MLLANTEEEAERSEALDEFPPVAPRTFPTVLVSGSDVPAVERKTSADRRYSLLETQDDVEAPDGKADSKAAETIPAPEIEEDNEPSFSGETSDPLAEPIPWRRQQSVRENDRAVNSA